MPSLIDVIPVQQFMPGALAEILRKAPLTPEKVAFAWRSAVGPAVDKATTVDLRNGVLHVQARDAQLAARSRTICRPDSIPADCHPRQCRSFDRSHIEAEDMQDAVIVSAVRTPTGRFLGGAEGILGHGSSARSSCARRFAAPASIPRPSTNASWATSSRRASDRRRPGRRRCAAGSPITSPR